MNLLNYGIFFVQREVELQYIYARLSKNLKLPWFYVIGDKRPQGLYINASGLCDPGNLKFRSCRSNMRVGDQSQMS